MNAKRSAIIGASMLTFCLCSQAVAQYVRLAELEIDPAQLHAERLQCICGFPSTERAMPFVGYRTDGCVH